MTPFELAYLAAEPFLPPLYGMVRKKLLEFARQSTRGLEMLDVGGRKSNYTVAVPARILVSDLPRKAAVQKRLHLGITNPIVREVLNRRTNIWNIVFDDMTASALKSESFDCVVAVEVLEHVKQDADFIREVHRVLKPNGHFLMTTPNGDAVANTNPDHQRHYTRDDLTALLQQYFGQVQVDCAVVGGRFYYWGLYSWSPKRPVTTTMSMVGNFINSWQSRSATAKDNRSHTRHLLATATKTV